MYHNAADANLYDLWSQTARQNPHALYRRMRAEAPICRLISPRTGNVIWLFTRHADSLAILKDARFLKDARSIPMPTQPEEGQINRLSSLDTHILTLDPPDHTRMRRLVGHTFSAKTITRLTPRIQQIADTLIDTLLAQGTFDLLDQFALPLPIFTIAELLGLPVTDHHQFKLWAHALIHDHQPEEAAVAGMEMIRYFLKTIEQRRRNPQDDFISSLVHHEDDGDRLNQQEMLAMLFLLVLAGHETTVSLISNGVFTLLRHPDQLAHLRAAPEKITTAVEEMLRYESPVENTLTRYAAQEMDWAGHLIHTGDLVFAGILSANRDEHMFADPDRFDITRDPNPHIAFGYGIHYCLGAPLARLQGAIAINSLLERLPHLSFAVPPNSLEWSDHIQFHRLKALPLSVR